MYRIALDVLMIKLLSSKVSRSAVWKIFSSLSSTAPPGGNHHVSPVRGWTCLNHGVSPRGLRRLHSSNRCCCIYGFSGAASEYVQCDRFDAVNRNSSIKDHCHQLFRRRLLHYFFVGLSSLGPWHAQSRSIRHSPVGIHGVSPRGYLKRDFRNVKLQELQALVDMLFVKFSFFLSI